jgi:hypothetical protein
VSGLKVENNMIRIVHLIAAFALIALLLSAAYLSGGMLSGRSGMQDITPTLMRVSLAELLGLAFGGAVLLGIGRRPGAKTYLRDLTSAPAFQIATLATVALLCIGLATTGSFSYLAAFVPGVFLCIRWALTR